MDKRLYSRRIHYKTDAYGSYIANCLFLLECLGTAWQTGNVIIRNEGFERQRRMTAPFLPSFSQTRCLQWRLIQSYFPFKTYRFWKKARNGAGSWQRTWDGFSYDISLVSRPEQIKTRSNEQILIHSYSNDAALVHWIICSKRCPVKDKMIVLFLNLFK